MRLIWHYYQSDELRNIECRVFGVCAMIHLMPFTWRSFGHKNPNTPASVASCRCMLVGWDWIKRSIFEYCNTPIYLFIYSAKHFNSRCCPGVDWQLCCFPSMVGRSVCFFLLWILLKGWAAIPISWLEIYRIPWTTNWIGQLNATFSAHIFSTANNFVFFSSLYLSFCLVHCMCSVCIFHKVISDVWHIDMQTDRHKMLRTNRNAIQFYASMNRESIHFIHSIQSTADEWCKLVKQLHSCAGSDCLCQRHVKRAFDAKTCISLIKMYTKLRFMNFFFWSNHRFLTMLAARIVFIRLCFSFDHMA